MGFNLWDIGSFATGAIERDREHTAENLIIRADELAAKRNSLIQRKNKKYDAEIFFPQFLRHMPDICGKVRKHIKS